MKTDIQAITKPLLNRYVDFLNESFGDNLLSAAVFGSFARGIAKFPGSDIDILIVIKGIEKLSFGERIKQTIKVEKELSKTEEYVNLKMFLNGLPAFKR